MIFAVDDEIGTSIFLTNKVSSGCELRWHLRVPPWPRRRDASVERADAAARNSATATLAVKHALVAV